MSDHESNKCITMDVLEERERIKKVTSFHPDQLQRQLRGCETSHEKLEVFRTLINIKRSDENRNDVESTAKWKPIIVSLLEILASSKEIGEERVLLGALAFVNVLFHNCKPEEFTNHLRIFWSLEKPSLSAFNEDYQICDLELFKLMLIHGYVNINIEAICTPEIIALPFEILRRNCLSYTKYSYFAYKSLQSWLDKSAKTNFWYNNDTRQMEKQLEAIIISNWDSCICETARRNATEIFPTYLRLMNEKYEGFSEIIFEKCIQNLSWQNETKYTILAEVCKIWEDLPKVVNSDLPACIFTSLTKNHLKHAGTKLYLMILKMLKTNDWERVFGESFLRISEKWEKEEQLAAIQLLWEQWMKPTMTKFPQIFQYLWKNDYMNQMKLNRTYLERIGDSLGFELLYEDTNIRDVLNTRIEDISEPVRANAFAIICQNKNWTYVESEDEPFAVVKRFLYFNIDTSSVELRKVILKNFTILIDNIQMFVSESSIDNHQSNKVYQFHLWLHEFLLECLEIGSSYQRKNLGLSLYKVMLDVRYRENKVALRKRSSDNEKIECNRKAAYSSWKQIFTDRRSLMIFLKLVLDPMADIREKSAHIIAHHPFDQNTTLSCEEHRTLTNLTERYCNSSKFYEAASGSKMMRVHSTWRNPGQESEEIELHLMSSSTSAFNEATAQLKKMEETQDILNCAVNGSPFFGSMMTLLELACIRNLYRNEFFHREATKVLSLAKRATKFFLSALSSKSEELEFSSSFEEMGLAIEDSIRNSEVTEDAEECILSSSHQLVLSCIWMSLKVCCELAAVVGMRDREYAVQAANLIVSVLLKCRHKGAIEAAGLALAELTSESFKKGWDNIIEKHLSDLLNIDDRDTISLTRRGAGLSIMFHRIVSNDVRRNRPTLHFSVLKLLDSLKTKIEDTTNLQIKNCIKDSSRARHLHFLKSLVADKSLQAQLVPYMEDICLTCFEYLQSPEWIVRNASLQLLGAIIPRLVGQCSAKELDYGVGNSVDHFVTHYPILADSVLKQLASLAASFDIMKNSRDANLYIESNIVPILTLFSKMSTGGCDLVDYSSINYISKAKRAFLQLFGYPVFHVRILASKAYAAFVALPDIPRELAKLKHEAVNDKGNNYQHGQLCAQIYLGRKLEHEMQCTSKTFFIREHKIHEVALKKGLNLQLRRFDCISKHRVNQDDWTFCYTVNATLIRCLIESQHFLCRFNMIPEKYNSLIQLCNNVPTLPGAAEFVKNLEDFHEKYNIDTRNDNLQSRNQQNSNNSTLRKDDRLLFSRIREISEKLHDDDEDVQRSVVDLLPSLVEESSNSQNDQKLYFDPRSECSKLWVEVIITMLTDEDSEVRELMAITLHPVIRGIIGGSSDPLCSRSVCHKILNKLSLMWKDDPSESMIDSLFEIFQRLASTIKITGTTEGLKSPFNQDETFNRDHTSFINILFYCVKTLIERKSPTGISIDNLEVQQISGIIDASNIIVREAFVDSTNIEIILQLSTSDYLSRKKRFLMEKFDEHRSMKYH